MWSALLRKITLGMLASLCVTAVMAFDISQQLLDQIEAKYGEAARARLERWEQLLGTPHSLSDDRKLMLVNSFFNQIKFKSDEDHWKQEDYWATPLELLVTDGGDCEDYSIAKYFTLRHMGVPDSKLRITYVKALKLNQAHMVLAYYATPDAMPLILDNLTNKILPADQRDDLYPVYSFNGDGLWLSKQRGEGKRIGKSTKLTQWNLMNERLLKQLSLEN